MSAADRWSVELSIREHEGETRADARLVMDNDPHLLGHGTARRSPSDPNVMEIGEKIAVARARCQHHDQLLHRPPAPQQRAGPAETTPVMGPGLTGEVPWRRWAGAAGGWKCRVCA